MRRRLLNILTALSLVVCVAVAVLWVRSYWVADSYLWGRRDSLTVVRWAQVVSAPGAIRATKTTIVFTEPRTEEYAAIYYRDRLGWHRDTADATKWRADLIPSVTRQDQQVGPRRSL